MTAPYEKTPTARPVGAGVEHALGGGVQDDCNAADEWLPDLPPDLAAFDAAVDGVQPERASERAAQPRVTAGVADREPEDETRRIRFVRASDLKPRSLPWLIRGVLSRDSNANLVAPSNTYKTFCALSWAYHVAAGIDWSGCRVDGGPVFYIAGEGLNGLPLRLRALEIEHGRALADMPLFVSTGATALTNMVAVAEMLMAVAAMEQEAGAKPALVIVDTFARSFGPGADENSTQDMGAAVAGVDAIRRQTGACVLLIHHCGHGDKTRGRGNSALYASLDWEYLMERDDSGLVWLRCTKAKDADAPEPVGFQPTRVELGMVDEDGEPIANMILRPVPGIQPTAKGKAARGKNQTRALAILRQEFQRRRANVIESGRDPVAVPVDMEKWRELCEADGIDRKRFHDVRKTLADSGAIRIACGNVFLSSSADL